jgi:hypothetical protein
MKVEPTTGTLFDAQQPSVKHHALQYHVPPKEMKQAASSQRVEQRLGVL